MLILVNPPPISTPLSLSLSLSRPLPLFTDYLARTGRADERAPLYYALNQVLPPRSDRDSPKLVAARAKILIANGYENLGEVCDIYQAALHVHPHSAMLANNVGVCHLRTPATLPLARPLFAQALLNAHIQREVQSIEQNIKEMDTNDGSRQYSCSLLF